MLYLLDANVLITANRDYYPLQRVPQFWDWLLDRGEAGEIKVPQEMYDEVVGGTDDASTWLQSAPVRRAMVLDEEADPALVAYVVESGYAHDLNDAELEKVGKDPFLIAYALARPERCVVTVEVSKPTQTRANRRVPDVCDDLGVRHCNTFELCRHAGFSTRA
jgi:hypothetical protein